MRIWLSVETLHGNFLVGDEHDVTYEEYEDVKRVIEGALGSDYGWLSLKNDGNDIYVPSTQIAQIEINIMWRDREHTN